MDKTLAYKRVQNQKWVPNLSFELSSNDLISATQQIMTSACFKIEQPHKTENNWNISFKKIKKNIGVISNWLFQIFFSKGNLWKFSRCSLHQTIWYSPQICPFRFRMRLEKKTKRREMIGKVRQIKENLKRKTMERQNKT